MSAAAPSHLNGVLNINKPAGMTSHDVVAAVRRAYRTKKVGHTGTLDPDATGVLLVCLGNATRLADLFTDLGKHYRALLQLGTTTSTADASGDVLTTADAGGITQQQVEQVLGSFRGEILQTPPMVSAVHHEGRRLYELAREGIEVERTARPVTIHQLTLQSFAAGAHATAVLDVHCSKGTYIRTLCADIGAQLGVGGHMAHLVRTAVGAFTVDAAVPLEHVAAHPEDVPLVDCDAALYWLPEHALSSPAELDHILHGRSVTTQLPDTPLVRISRDGTLAALGRVDGGAVFPTKVFRYPQ